jgi:GDPmannose 4,6-dehydratase
MNTAVITGITGQDGSYLAELLLEKDYTVIGIIRRSSTNTTERLTNVIGNPQFKLIEGDITDSGSINNILQEYQPHEFYNLAAQSHVATSFNQPEYTFDVNCGGVMNILEGIRYVSPDTKLYQASTSEMFGGNYDVDFETGLKYQSLTTDFAPRSPYAIAKLAAHNMVGLYREAYNLHVSCGILFNHESPRRGELFVTRKITKWLAEFKKYYKPCFEQGQISVTLAQDWCNRIYNSLADSVGFPKLRLGNVDSYRDWGHAKDYVKAMWAMLQHEAPKDYIIATGETHSIREFLDVTFNYVGLNNWEDFVFIDSTLFRPSEVDYLCGDAGLANVQLNWYPTMSFEDLVKDMIDSEA